jgi:hypothetical protein
MTSIGLAGNVLELGTHNPELALAWLALATTEAHDNPAGFVAAGIRSGAPPARRLPRGHASQSSPAPLTELERLERRARFVAGDGARLPVDELEFQLTEMGAGPDELVELLSAAADRLRMEVAG